MATRNMRPLNALAYAGLSSLLAPVTHAILPYTCRSSPLSSPSTQQCSAYSTSLPSGSVTYRLAVSFCGKGRRVNPSRDVRAFDIPFLKSRGQTAVAGAPPASGQDAFFMSSIGGSDTDVAFGIADGVGGWMESGIDPSAFSEGLCRHMAYTAGTWDDADDKSGRSGPQRLMQAGYDGTIRDPEVEGGGSTACVAIGRTDGSFEVANLGDSGFAHYRPNATSYVSPPQIHAFNTPYQLSLIPEHIMRQSRMYGGEPLHDYPRDAATTTHSVAHGDVLVFASDGVWDNLNAADVLDVVRKEMEGSKSWVVDKAGKGEVIGSPDLANKTRWKLEAEEVVDGAHGVQTKARTDSADESTLLQSVQEKIAYQITKQAQAAAANMNRESPFGKELRRWYPAEQWQGGKVDDIAVIVAVIVGV